MIPNLKKKLQMLSQQKIKDIPGHNVPNQNESCHEISNKSVSNDELSNRHTSNHDISYQGISNHGITGDSDSTDNRGLLGGTILNSEFGSHVIKRSLVPLESKFGEYSLENLLRLNDKRSRLWTRIDKAFSYSDLIFLDTETTGLAGGTGTTAFLIGLGYIENAELVIEQHIMRDFDEEEAMLQRVFQSLRSHKILVTFNGKSFDWPLLESRFISSRIRTIDWYNSHIDLLHISRRLWKLQYSDCSLSSLERNVLRYFRIDDIPGYLIPSVYLNYLETREEKDMEKVIEHNKLDIISMAALISYIDELYNSPLSSNEYELFGIATEYEFNKKYKDAVFYYERCIETSENKRLADLAKKKAACLLKRERNYDEALRLWEDLAESYSGPNVLPLIEIAKYFEHKAKDYKTALLYTERALRYVTLYNITTPCGVKQKIEHRKKRLVRKIERIDNL